MCTHEAAIIDGDRQTNRRAARIEKLISQAELGERLGVSFQQVQKYEKGMNRLAVGRLLQCASLLGKSLDWFYAGSMPDKAGKTPPDITAQILATAAGRRLVLTYLAADPRDRAAILAVADALASEARPLLQAAE